MMNSRFPRVAASGVAAVLTFALMVITSNVHAETAYIAPEQVPLSALLGPPPSAESAQQKLDLKAVIDAQAARTEAQVARAKVTADLSVFAFADVLGPGFAKEHLPKTALLFSRIYHDSVASLEVTKNLWKRPRPFATNSEVNPIERPGSTSYPSGNALLGQLYAIVLAHIVPEKSAEIFARGHETGDNRVIAGVHYPTDLAAGRQAAVAIAVALWSAPTYREDLAAATAELRAALKL
ncbi:acid phosphatase [Bradyrhizobium sp.]|uniref:acid phosphatase n=1 Tax=Bradyrhizobium sp. TaxID=376 RepID=UPI0039E24A2D